MFRRGGLGALLFSLISPAASFAAPGTAPPAATIPPPKLTPAPPPKSTAAPAPLTKPVPKPVAPPPPLPEPPSAEPILNGWCVIAGKEPLTALPRAVQRAARMRAAGYSAGVYDTRDFQNLAWGAKFAAVPADKGGGAVLVTKESTVIKFSGE